MLEMDLAPNRGRSYITYPGYRVGMKPPNAGKTYPAEVLTRDEVHRLLSACSRRGHAGLRNRALIVLLWRTGLRISEALALEVKDIDLEGGTVRVLHGKNDRARTVGIDAGALAILEDWMARRRELGVPRGAPVFCTITRPNIGSPVYSSVVREMLKDLAVKAGIEKRVHPHGFRHTHASELASENMPLNLIQKQLGHKNLAVTAHYIDHLQPEQVIRAIHGRPEWATSHDASLGLQLGGDGPAAG
jgi:integrase